MDSEVESGSGPDVVNTGVVREIVGHSHVQRISSLRWEKRCLQEVEVSSIAPQCPHKSIIITSTIIDISLLRFYNEFTAST